MSRGNGYQKGCKHKGVIISIDANLPLPISWKVHAMFISRFYFWAGVLMPVPYAAEAELLAQAVPSQGCCPALQCSTIPDHGPALGCALATSTCNNQKPETPHACAPSYRRIALESQRFFLFFWEWGRGWDAAAAGEEYVSGAAMT